MPRKASKNRMYSLWLDEADLQLLNRLAERYNTSRQRIIEASITHACATGFVAARPKAYQRFKCIPFRVDELTAIQISQLVQMHVSPAQNALRLALRSFAKFAPVN